VLASSKGVKGTFCVVPVRVRRTLQRGAQRAAIGEGSLLLTFPSSLMAEPQLNNLAFLIPVFPYLRNTLECVTESRLGIFH
jgi:hypothetical protein